MKQSRKKVLKIWLKKSTAMALTVSIISCGAAVKGFAGPPAIDTDEAVYVNLDYYGGKTHTSVVKGCNLNGIRSFTDYGAYKDVTNMSNHAQPVILKDGVTWNLPKDSKERFYYECQMDNDSIVLPWDFDISYRLNGVPAEAEKLAGASGLVAIDVECTPNEKAKEYYKNNMLLQMGTVVNMEDVNSIEAPGSQTQSLGTYKVILFAAVPGETTTFHMEIGTDNFQSSGIYMMMIPGTLDQMKELKNIREMKDTFSDSADALVDSLNAVLDKLDGLTSGVTTTKKGLEQLKKAKAKFDASKDSLDTNVDAGIDALSGLGTTLVEIGPDIENTHNTLQDISREMDQLVGVARDSEEDFANLGGKLNGLKNDLRDLQGDLKNTGNVSQAKVDKLQAQLDGIQAKLDQMSEVMDHAASGSIPPEQILPTLNAMKKQALAMIKSLEPYIGKSQADGMRQELLDAIKAAGSGDMSALVELFNEYSGMVSQLQDVINELQAILDNKSVDGTLTSSSGVLNELDRVSADLDNAMAEVENINTIKHRDKDTIDKMIDDTQAASQSLANSTGSLVNALRILRDTEKSARSSVEGGTEKLLNGLIDVLGKAAEESTATDQLKDANERMKNSVKSELDKVEDKTNLLNLDTDENLISFTSDKNRTPASIQIILKTQEIDKDSVVDHSKDIEPAEVNQGAWYRVTQVFVKLWDGIKGIFQ